MGILARITAGLNGLRGKPGYDGKPLRPGDERYDDYGQGEDDKDESDDPYASHRELSWKTRPIADVIHGGNFGEKVWEAVQKATQAIQEAAQHTDPQYPNPDAGTEFDDRFYIDISKAAPLDLPPTLQHTAQRMALLLYRKNVRATRAVNLVTDFAWAEGPTIRANDQEVQKLLDLHWAVNQWSQKGPERCRALGIFGEQMYPVISKDETTGVVRISSVSPLNIKKANRDETNAEDIESIQTSLKKHKDPFDVIRLRPDGQLSGEAFFFAVNRVAGATRGLPDMLSAIDWLEGMDQFVFSLMERANVASNIVWDLECKGLKPREIRKRVKEFVRALRKMGGVYGHNEKTALNIKVPNLASADAETTMRMLLKQISSGTGLAGLFFGDNADLTRASASELSIPVAKMIQARQTYIIGMLTDILDYQIQEAKACSALAGVQDFSYTIELPPVYLRDVETVAKALGSLANSLAIAVEQRWMTEAQAGKTFRAAVAQLGAITEAGPSAELSAGERELAEIMDRTHGRDTDKGGQAAD